MSAHQPMLAFDLQPGPSPRFVRLTRNPDLPVPPRFEPTRKRSGDVVIGGRG